MDIIGLIGFIMCMIGSAIEFTNENYNAGMWAGIAAL